MDVTAVVKVHSSYDAPIFKRIVWNAIEEALAFDKKGDPKVTIKTIEVVNDALDAPIDPSILTK